MEARDPSELRLLNTSDHPATPLVNHAATQGVPITIPKVTTKVEQEKYLRYRAHAYVT